jgi:hypothetical protein
VLLLLRLRLSNRGDRNAERLGMWRVRAQSSSERCEQRSAIVACGVQVQEHEV